jgi:hypothetical protein
LLLSHSEMLGLAKGMMPGRQVAQDKKSARRKNQNNEGTLPWAMPRRALNQR